MRWEKGDKVCSDCWGDETHTLQVKGYRVYCDSCQTVVGTIEYYDEKVTEI